LCSNFVVRDQFLDPFKTTGKIIVLYMLNFMSSYDGGIIKIDGRQNEHAVFCVERWKINPQW
jgi:hypothetical protein